MCRVDRFNSCDCIIDSLTLALLTDNFSHYFSSLSHVDEEMNSSCFFTSLLRKLREHDEDERERERERAFCVSIACHLVM